MPEPTVTDRDRELAYAFIYKWIVRQEEVRKPFPVDRANQELAEFRAQARQEGREEVMETMKPELYRLAGVETRARRAGGNIREWAESIREELRKPGGERHAAGHLHRITEEAERLLDQPAPDRAKE